jgi:hypothetical protein
MERETLTLKVFIEKMVKDEIENIAGEIKSLVKQTVKGSFISEIRESVKNAISETMEEILAETQEHEFMTFSKDTEADTSLSEERGANGNGDNSGRYIYCIVERMTG